MSPVPAILSGGFRTLKTLVSLIAVMVIPFAVLILAPFAVFLWLISGESGCKQTPVSRTPSPDGAWIAAVTYQVCSDGLFVTIDHDRIDLLRPGEVLSEESRVYLAEVSMHPEVNWLSLNRLQIDDGGTAYHRVLNADRRPGIVVTVRHQR